MCVYIIIDGALNGETYQPVHVIHILVNETLSDYFGISQLKLQQQKNLGLSEISSKICICTDSCSNHRGVAMCADN